MGGIVKIHKTKPLTISTNFGKLKERTMTVLNVRRMLSALLLTAALFVTSCQGVTPAGNTSDRVARSTPQPAVSAQAIPAGQFNKFFPQSANGFERVYSQEKPGTAEAKLQREGKEVALLSIFDTISNPDATTKFKGSPKTIAGYPAQQIGNSQTALLVADRFQVKAISRDPSFTATDRETWLQKFNLSGLAQLK
jgi:hypothetical protein